MFQPHPRALDTGNVFRTTSLSQTFDRKHVLGMKLQEHQFEGCPQPVMAFTYTRSIKASLLQSLLIEQRSLLPAACCIRALFKSRLSFISIIPLTIIISENLLRIRIRSFYSSLFCRSFGAGRGNRKAGLSLMSICGNSDDHYDLRFLYRPY
jgi:hypothetical protein